MELICQSFYFYPNGQYKTTHNFGKYFRGYTHDIEEVSTAIRILGTPEQIDKALDDYCKATGLNVDEGFNFTDKDKIKEYTKEYKNKALIINLI